MIRPLTIVPGGFNHVLVIIDKFTKWIEYKPITNISADKAVDFICDIIHRLSSHDHYRLGFKFHLAIFFGILRQRLHRCQVCVHCPSRANGQVERINGLILDGPKKRVYDANTKKGYKWIYEVPHVIWWLRT